MGNLCIAELEDRIKVAQDDFVRAVGEVATLKQERSKLEGKIVFLTNKGSDDSENTAPEPSGPSLRQCTRSSSRLATGSTTSKLAAKPAKLTKDQRPVGSLDDRVEPQTDSSNIMAGADGTDGKIGDKFGTT